MRLTEMSKQSLYDEEHAGRYILYEITQFVCLPKPLPLPGACVPLMLSMGSFVRWRTLTLYALMRHGRGYWPRDTGLTSLTSVWMSTRDSMFGTSTNHVPGSPSFELLETIT